MKRRNFSRRWVVSVALLSAGTAAAAGVVVVRTSELAPYKAVELAFIKEVGQSVQSVSPSADIRQAVGDASLVLAIGPDAVKAVEAAKPSAPVLVALMPNASFGPEIKSRLVPMFVPPLRQAKLIHQVLPNARRVGVIYDPTHSKALVSEFDSAATAAGMTLHRAEVSSKQEVAAAVRSLVEKVDVIWLVPDTTVIGAESFKFIVQTSFEKKIPLVGFSQAMARAGALLSVEAEYEEIGRIAGIAARKGPTSVPESPEGKVYLNAKTAGILGITLPQSVRGQAANVFE